MPAKADIFSQRMYQSVTESAAGTMTEEQFNIQTWGFGRNDAMIIHEIQYDVSADEWNKIIAEADHLYFGVCTQNAASAPRGNDPTMLDRNEYGFRISGTPAVDEILNERVVKNFSTYPGGGILTIPSPLYVYVMGVSLASAVTIGCTLFFTMKSLKPAEFIELTQIMRMAV